MLEKFKTNIKNAFGVNSVDSDFAGDIGSAVDLDQLSSASGGSNWSSWNGDKFSGGFGDTKLFTVDYYTVRARSTQLFQENLYARGTIRRVVSNVIGTGIELESLPDSEILNMSDDELDAWSENTESLFSIWGENPKLCDFKGQKTFAQLQDTAKQAALVSGDVLVIQHIDPVTSLPKIELIAGSKINDPLLGFSENLAGGNIIKHGVEVDTKGRHVAYYIDQDDGTSKRVAAKGKKTGRPVAWLVYGGDNLIDEVRGQPLLAIVLQSLKEIDRYRDSVQRKALVNSFFAMFIKKTQAKTGTMPISNAGVNLKTVALGGTDDEGNDRKFNVANYMPGTVFDELQQGEEPVSMKGDGTDVNFGDFERTIVSSIAWALQIPPEILLMSFNKSYSASQAAINEYRIILSRDRYGLGRDFCQPIFQTFLINQVLISKISAPGLIESWRDPLQWDIFGAWLKTDWFGTVKPAADIMKTVKAYQLLVDGGFITYAQATRELTGKKWRVVMKVQKKEREIMALTMAPTAEFNQKFNGNSDGLLGMVQKVAQDAADETGEKLLSLIENAA